MVRVHGLLLVIVTLANVVVAEEGPLTAKIYDITPGSVLGEAHVVQYVYYTSKKDFNTARQICRSIGGDLAKIETEAKRNWISAMDPVTFKSDLLWLGMVETTSDNPTWVSDCSSANQTAPAILDDWSSSIQCSVLKEDPEKFSFYRKSCDEPHNFLCELYTAITPADIDVNTTDVNSSADVNAECYTENTTQITTSTVSGTTSSATTQSPASTTQSPTTSTAMKTPTTQSTTAATQSPTTATQSPTITILLTTSSPQSPTTTQYPTTTTQSPPAITLLTTSTFYSSTTKKSPATTLTTQSPTSSTLPSLAPPSPDIACSNATQQQCRCNDLFRTTTPYNLSVDVTVEELVRNLTIDVKYTSAYRRKLTCAEDNRPTVRFIGYSYVLVAALPFCVIALSDIQKIVQDSKRFCGCFKSTNA